MIYVRDAPRSSDVLVLEALRDRQLGIKLARSSERLGVSSAYLSANMRRAKRDDIEHAAFWGDDPAEVEGFYR